MKRFSLVLVCVLACQMLYAQCIPQAPTGQAGLSPITDSLPCVNRGEYYSEVFYLENFSPAQVAGIQVTVDSLRIDSIANGPCNLQWIANEGSNVWYTSETGCIRIFGTTTDSVGQYKLEIYATVFTNILGPLSGEVSDIIDGLENTFGQSLGIDFDYWLRVKESGMPCVALIKNDSTKNLTANLNCSITNAFRVDVSAPGSVCIGDSVLFSATTSGTSTALFSWESDNTLDDTTIATPKVFPTTSDYYTVTLTDTSTGNVTYDRVFVKVNQGLPDASFNAVNSTTNLLKVAFSSDVTDALSYQWVFGDGDTAFSASAIHTYPGFGTYVASLTLTNACGIASFIDTVEIPDTATSILQIDLFEEVSVYPNPASSSFQISLTDAVLALQPTVTIFNLVGEAVSVVTDVKHTNTIVNSSEYVAGLYFVVIKTQNGTSTQKLIIQ